MAALNVGKAAEFKDRDRRLVSHGETEIGVFFIKGKFYAYRNICVHQGGPVCRGKIINRVVEVLGDDMTSQGLEFSQEDVHLVCPWHGYEFNLETGIHPGRSSARLKSYPVEVRDGDVFVLV